jgi:hypothetical protein
MENSTGRTNERQRLHPPFAQPDPGRRATPHGGLATIISDDLAASDANGVRRAIAAPSGEELPPIERFTDDLPLIDEFLVHDESRVGTSVGASQGTDSDEQLQVPAKLEIDSEGWAAADWQSYDWGGLTVLGTPAPEAAAAHAAWSSTNWEPAGRGLGATGGSALPGSDEVAHALDEMARRIRSGELSLEQFASTPPEAAIAALFAALLRNRG